MTSTAIPKNLVFALNQLQNEVAKVEQALLELRQKKLEFLQDQLSTGLEKLSIQADKVNTLANSLESEILNFKKTAVEVNNIYETIQASPSFKTIGKEKSLVPSLKLINIWESNSLNFSVPTVVRQEFQFILTVKTIDLHQQTAPQESLKQTIKPSASKDRADSKGIYRKIA